MNDTNAQPLQVPFKCTRTCAGFDPAAFMGTFEYSNGFSEKYLEVKYRRLWHNIWCAENNIDFQIFSDKYDINLDLNMIFCTCTIMWNGKEVASASAGRAIPDDFEGRNIVYQSCATCAEGRALNHLGFNTVNGSGMEDGERFPPDSGIPLPRATPETNPLVVDPVQPQVTEPVVPGPKKRGRKPKPEAVQQSVSASVAEAVPTPASSSPVATAVIPTTVDEAKDFTCPVGIDRGKRMGEIYATDPDKVKFFCSDLFVSKDRYPGLVAAAKLIIDEHNARRGE